MAILRHFSCHFGTKSLAQKLLVYDCEVISDYFTNNIGKNIMADKKKTVPVKGHVRSTPSSPPHKGPGNKPGPKTVDVDPA